MEQTIQEVDMALVPFRIAWIAKSYWCRMMEKKYYRLGCLCRLYEYLTSFYSNPSGKPHIDLIPFSSEANQFSRGYGSNYLRIDDVMGVYWKCIYRQPNATTGLDSIYILYTLQQWHLREASNSTLVPKFLPSGLAPGKMKMPRRQQSLLPSRQDIATLTLQDGRYWTP